MKLYYGALTAVIAGGFLVSGCGPTVCEDGSQPPTGVCPEDCAADTEFYDDDTFTCRTIEDEDCADAGAGDGDGEDNDGDGDVDCRDSDCDEECVEPWVPVTYSIEGYFAWDADNQQAVNASFSGTPIPPAMVFTAHTADYPNDFDDRYACSVFAEAEGPLSNAAFATDAEIPVGWELPASASWSADAAGSQSVPPGCDTIEGNEVDVVGVFQPLTWGLGIQSDIDDAYEDDLKSQLADEADNLIGGGFYIGDGTEGQYNPEGWGVAFEIAETFELSDDDELMLAAQATTGASDMFVQTNPGYLYGGLFE